MILLISHPSHELFHGDFKSNPATGSFNGRDYHKTNSWKRLSQNQQQEDINDVNLVVIHTGPGNYMKLSTSKTTMEIIH